MQSKICPHCGASLPSEALFCPFCARSLQKKQALKPPRPKRKIILGILFTLVIVGLCAFLLYEPEPQVVEGAGQVVYQDRDNVYQITVSINEGGTLPWAATPYISNSVAPGTGFRYPAQLLIYRNGYDPAIQEEFLEKVLSCTVTATPVEGGQAMQCTTPAPTSEFPKAALVSHIAYNEQSLLNEIRWSFLMENGDTIILTHQIEAIPLQEVNYYPEDYPMETIEDLEQLLEIIYREQDAGTVVNLHLPAVTYDGGLTLNRRSVNLYGTINDDRQTTFAGTVYVKNHEPDPADFSDICFAGTEGVGLEASAGVYLQNCTFTGWDTGLLAVSGGSFILRGCTFENNDVGAKYATDWYSYFSGDFPGCTFRGNSIGFWLKELPTDSTLTFQDSVFADNGINLQNDAGHSIDLSETTYQ